MSVQEPELADVPDALRAFWRSQVEKSERLAAEGKHDAARVEHNIAAGVALSSLVAEEMLKRSRRFRFRPLEWISFVSVPLCGASLAAGGHWGWFAGGITVMVTFSLFMWIISRRR